MNERRSFTNKEIRTDAMELAQSLGATNREDVITDIIEKIKDVITKYKVGVIFEDGSKESESKKRAKNVQTFEEFLNESYKQIPYNMKISGKFEITINGNAFSTSIAGFERQSDDSDSLYLMDNDPLKAEHGSFIVKNSDMPKLQKGTVVKGVCSKHNTPVTLKRIGDL